MIDSELIIERNCSPKPRFSLLDTMRVERGTMADWNALHDLHYKAQSLPAAPHFWRCITADDELVGVIVLSAVSLLLAPRHAIFPKIKPGNDTHFTNVHRAKFLNNNFRRAARIVTDTLYRGVGVSYRMVNLAMRMEGYKFVEIQSSMSKFNPFDTKAGFRHAHLRNAAAFDLGLKFMRRYFSAYPADSVAVLGELNAMPEKMREGVFQEMREFYYRHSMKEKTGSNTGNGTSKVDKMTAEALIGEIIQLVFATPVYGIWQNPDLGIELPQSLPLSAFDLQSPTEPLRLDLL